MTEVLNIYNMQEYIVKDQKESKFDTIRNVLEIRKNDAYEQTIRKNIVTNDEVRNGKATIKGTRITPKELVLFIAEKMELDKKDGVETNYKEIKNYLYQQYPSIKNEKQIEAALYYTLKYDINIVKYILVVLFL